MKVTRETPIHLVNVKFQEETKCSGMKAALPQQVMKNDLGNLG
jgi:hypothetical protein